MNPIKKWNSLSLFTRIMIGFVLGIGAGLVLGEKASAVAFLGTILTRLLTSKTSKPSARSAARRLASSSQAPQLQSRSALCSAM